MKAEILIDWLTFSVKNELDPVQVISEYLGIDTCLFQEQGFGLYGYMNALEFNGIMVLYNPAEGAQRQNMGVCVSMSGNGCRTFENYSSLNGVSDIEEQGTGYTAFPILFKLLLENDCNISRIDIACDDHNGDLDMDSIVDSVMDNDICTRLQKRQVVLSYDGNDLDGRTVYFGAPSSDFRVRIYDKAKEQGDLKSHWIRVELVFRGKNALAFVENFVNCESLGTLATGVINDKFRFINRDDTNITRCSTCDWWENFMENLSAIQIFSREIMQHDIDEVEEWAIHQLAPTMGMLYKAKGSIWLDQFIKDGQQRLSNKQEILAQDYRNARIDRFRQSQRKAV